MATRPSRANKTLHPLSVTLTPSPRQPGRPVFSLFTLQHPLFPPEMCFFLWSIRLLATFFHHPRPFALLAYIHAILLFLSLPLCTPPIPSQLFTPFSLSLVHRLDRLSFSLPSSLPPSLPLRFVELIRASWSTGLSFALLHACMSRATNRSWNYIKTIPFGWLRFCGMFAVPLSGAHGFFEAD